MKPPYPWFGGKRRIAPLCWQAFGAPANYVEPFFGGGAVLLGRPDGNEGTETVNDINAHLCNFWRAVKQDPDMVAWHAADPVNEIDLHARGDALFYKGWDWYKEGKMMPDEFAEHLRADAEWCDYRMAGWWVWGQSAWIGEGWARKAKPKVTRQKPHLSNDGVGLNPGQVYRQTPALSVDGAGLNDDVGNVHRKVPILGNAGEGLNRLTVCGSAHRKMPMLGHGGRGLLAVGMEEPGLCADTPRLDGIRGYLRQLCGRMAKVRVCCGDWTRVMSDAVTTRHGATAIFLDPPYPHVAAGGDVYGEHETQCFHAVAKWCEEHGANPLLRIVMCGHDTDWTPPSDWRTVAWHGRNGYAKETNRNRDRERLWLSPACLPMDEPKEKRHVRQRTEAQVLERPKEATEAAEAEGGETEIGQCSP